MTTFFSAESSRSLPGWARCIRPDHCWQHGTSFFSMQPYVLGGYMTVSIYTALLLPGYTNYPTTSLSGTIEPLLTLIRIYLIKLSRRTFHNSVVLVKFDLYLLEAASFVHDTQHPIERNWCNHSDGKMAASFERQTNVSSKFPPSEL